MIEIWNKEKIAKLTLDEKYQKFDVLNNKLEEDRNISLSDPFIFEKQRGIKNDYFRYIENCAYSDIFYKYYILKLKDKIISVCRINIYDKIYLLEGLQTHKNHFRRGYATKLIIEMIHDLKKDGIEILYSEARKWNDASNNLQQKLGFIRYGENQFNYLYKIEILSYPFE